jgi:hypothetical protein
VIAILNPADGPLSAAIYKHMIAGVFVRHNEERQASIFRPATLGQGGTSTAQQRAWEREERRRLELPGQAEAERRNDELQRWIRALEHVLVWSLDHPVPVSFRQ